MLKMNVSYFDSTKQFYICRLDDRFISATYKNWSFGADFSGLMTNKENIDHFVDQCKHMRDIQLAIVNGTMTMSLDRQNGEQLAFDHHYAGLVAALKLLSKNGNLILISYTMFNAVNVSLMYFLNLAFEEVHLFKPATNPMTKCEFFIIGINFIKSAFVEKYIEEMTLRVAPNVCQNGNFHI